MRCGVESLGCGQFVTFLTNLLSLGNKYVASLGYNSMYIIGQWIFYIKDFKQFSLTESIKSPCCQGRSNFMCGETLWEC